MCVERRQRQLERGEMLKRAWGDRGLFTPYIAEKCRSIVRLVSRSVAVRRLGRSCVMMSRLSLSCWLEYRHSVLDFDLPTHIFSRCLIRHTGVLGQAALEHLESLCIGFGWYGLRINEQ